MLSEEDVRVLLRAPSRPIDCQLFHELSSLSTPMAETNALLRMFKETNVHKKMAWTVEAGTMHHAL